MTTQNQTHTKDLQICKKKKKRTDRNQANKNEELTKIANNNNHSSPMQQPLGDLERVVRMAKADRHTTTNWCLHDDGKIWTKRESSKCLAVRKLEKKEKGEED